MEANRPYDQGNEMDAEGIPDIEPPINQDEGQIPPRDYPQGADEFGVTAVEERLEEPIAERVLREEPEPDIDEILAADLDDDDLVGGRLIAPGGEDVDGVDVEKDEVALLVPDEGALTAEEAAMHITDAP